MYDRLVEVATGLRMSCPACGWVGDWWHPPKDHMYLLHDAYLAFSVCPDCGETASAEFEVA